MTEPSGARTALLYTGRSVHIATVPGDHRGTDPSHVDSGMASTPSPIPAPQPSLTLGAFLIGSYFGLLSYASKGVWWIKALVLSALVLETIVTAIDIDACYNYLVTNFGNPDIERAVHWSLSLIASFPASSALTCQIFFARRVWLVDRRYRLMVILMGAELSCTTERLSQIPRTAIARRTQISNESMRQRIQAPVPHPRHPTVAGLLAVWRSDNRGCPLDIGSHLHSASESHRHQETVMRAAMSRTDSMINVLIMYAVNTGLIISNSCLNLLSAANVVCLTCALVLPQSLTRRASYTPLSAYINIVLTIAPPRATVYVNSLLAALNSRQIVSDSGRLDKTNDVFGSVVFSRTIGTRNEEHGLHQIPRPRQGRPSCVLEEEEDTHSDSRSIPEVKAFDTLYAAEP
ncbi:hypothetical protein C8Q80DRAFT_1120134 [Daedaleopsis nitida]|nr:hypothetical protein C8Q80DRAFT_1120134 [Daedaleopsis nitida]